MKTEYDMK